MHLELTVFTALQRAAQEYKGHGHCAATTIIWLQSSSRLTSLTLCLLNDLLLLTPLSAPETVFLLSTSVNLELIQYFLCVTAYFTWHSVLEDSLVW